MSIFLQAKQDIDRGLLGLNQGLPFGLPRKDKLLYGVQQGMYYLIGGDTGCLSKGTQVMMFNGSFKNVEDVVIEDQLMGPDSTPRRVLKLFRGKQQMYWINQNKGDSYRVNEEHILSLKPSGVRAKKKFGEVVNIKVSDYIKLNSYDRTHLKGYKAGELVFNNTNQLEIDPYILGLWLGDGDSSSPAITTTDAEIMNALLDYSNIKGYSTKIKISTPNKVDIHKISFSGGSMKFRTCLSNYNLVGNKHIPKDYLYTSSNNRLQLLAGLLDTDGSYDYKKNSFEITQKRKELANEICFLARSLGFYTSIKKKKATIKSREFECDVYRVSIYGHLDKIPTRIARKQAKKSTRITSHLVTGITVTKDTVDNFYGFELDKDNLFLLGDLTVTHNSGKSHYVNNTFVFNPLDWVKHNAPSKEVEILYFSFEMAAKSHFLRLMPRYLWNEYAHLTDVSTILSRGNGNKLDKIVYNMIMAGQPYFEWIESKITFVDSAIGKKGIEVHLERVAKKNGVFIDTPGGKTYQPNDPDKLVLVILDHNGLSKREGEKDTKAVIDGISKVFVDYRNTCGFSFVVLNQFNRDIQSSDRKKLGAFEPQLSDFKDTSGSQEDADLVMAIADPWRYGYSKYKDFDISILQDKFRCLHVLKNRHGPCSKHIGLNFFGNLGIFEELPTAGNMTPDAYRWATDLEERKRRRTTP